MKNIIKIKILNKMLRERQQELREVLKTIRSLQNASKTKENANDLIDLYKRSWRLLDVTNALTLIIDFTLNED